MAMLPYGSWWRRHRRGFNEYLGIGFFAWQACTERAGVQKRGTLGTLLLFIKFKLCLNFGLYSLYILMNLL